MKAGAFTPAIPAGAAASSVRVRMRSMKAGAFTPAILLQCRKTGCGRSSATLNEGGGFHPRNPRSQWTHRLVVPFAQ